MSVYRYEFTDVSLRRFRKLPKPIQERIVRKLDFFCLSNPFLYAEKLVDRSIGMFRFRIGDYRVIVDLEDDSTLVIHDVGHRKDIYR